MAPNVSGDQLAETQDLTRIVNSHKRDDAFVGLQFVAMSGNAFSVNWPSPHIQDCL
jgi:hypothetical protein